MYCKNVNPHSLCAYHIYQIIPFDKANDRYNQNHTLKTHFEGPYNVFQNYIIDFEEYFQSNILSNINFSLILFFHFKFSQSFDTLSDLFVLKHTSNVFQKCFYFTLIYIELCRFTYCLNFVLVNILVARTIINQIGWSI